MDLALNNLQRLICHKTQQTKQNKPTCCHLLIKWQISDISRRSNAWSANNKLTITWKSYLTEKMKLEFFGTVAVSVLMYSYTTWILTIRP